MATYLISPLLKRHSKKKKKMIKIYSVSSQEKSFSPSSYNVFKQNIVFGIYLKTFPYKILVENKMTHLLKTEISEKSLQ